MRLNASYVEPSYKQILGGTQLPCVRCYTPNSRPWLNQPGQSSKTHSRMRVRRFPFGIIFSMMFSEIRRKGSCSSFSWSEKDDVFLTPSNQEGVFENSVFLAPGERYTALFWLSSRKHHRKDDAKRRALNPHPRMS